jgi:hypothetical protein
MLYQEGRSKKAATRKNVHDIHMKNSSKGKKCL